MFSRPAYRNVAAQQTCWHNTLSELCAEQHHALQIMPFYQQSIPSKKVARYFLFGNKNLLSVKGDAAIQGNPHLRDIRAEWVNLPSDFDGNLWVNPKQQQGALWLEYAYHLRHRISADWARGLWIAAALPLQALENNINLQQDIIYTPQASLNIINAFNQTSWHFAKFDGKQTAIGAAELLLKIGNSFANTNGFQVNAYVGMVFPLHKAQNPEFVLSPMIGNNSYYGFVSAALFQIPLYSTASDMLITFFCNIENICFLPTSQKRTLDLNFKPWSRYLLFNKNTGETNIPGVNVLTQHMNIKPYNTVDFSVGLRLEHGTLESEVSYNLWARSKELLSFKKPFYNEFGIAGDGTLVPGTHIAATANNSTINYQSSNDTNSMGDPIFVPITQQDINQLSGGAQSALNHRFAVAINYNTGLFFVSVGTSAEYAQKHTAFNTWGLWLKGGCCW